METKDILLTLRNKAGLSQEELADRVYVTRQAVSRWEKGETTPNTETLMLLSQLFDVSINTLLGSPRQLVCHCCGMPLADAAISRELDGLPNEAYSENEMAKIRNQKIGFVFQNFNLIPKLTAQENVELPLIYQKSPRAERVRRVREALERVNLSHRAKHLPTELSGGQQQRVAIARALVTNPSLILADEPTGNLDSKTSKEIMDIFHELHKQGNTIVLITHDNDVAKQAERAIHILDGQITEVTL